MEKFKYCDCFFLNPLQQDLSLNSDSNTEIKTYEYLTDYIPGKFILDSPALFIISQGYFYSVSSIIKGQNIELLKHRQINSSVQVFLVNSGRAYLLYPDHIIIFLLNTSDPINKISSSSKLSSIVLIDGLVFVSAGNKIKSIINDQFLMDKYETNENIIEIKSGFINDNLILVVMEYSFEILNVDIEDEHSINIEVIFSYECYNSFQVEFFNKNLLVLSDMYSNKIHFIDWSQSNETVFSIDIQEFHSFEMKVKQDIILLKKKEDGTVIFFFFNEATRRFYTFNGFIELEYECFDFDYEESDFTETCNLESSHTLNFFLSTKNSIHHFCLVIDLSLNFMCNYTFGIKSKSFLLDNSDIAGKKDFSVEKNPMFPDRLRMVEKVPDFQYPEPLNLRPMINIPLKNYEYKEDGSERNPMLDDRSKIIEQVYGGGKIGCMDPNMSIINQRHSHKCKEDMIDKIHNFFTDEYLKSLFINSFSTGMLPEPNSLPEREPFINLRLLENIKSTVDEIQRLISR